MVRLTIITLIAAILLAACQKSELVHVESFLDADHLFLTKDTMYSSFPYNVNFDTDPETTLEVDAGNLYITARPEPIPDSNGFAYAYLAVAGGFIPLEGLEGSEGTQVEVRFLEGTLYQLAIGPNETSTSTFYATKGSVLTLVQNGTAYTLPYLRETVALEEETVVYRLPPIGESDELAVAYLASETDKLWHLRTQSSSNADGLIVRTSANFIGPSRNNPNGGISEHRTVLDWIRVKAL